MRRYEDILKDLIEIKERGFIKTHRRGNTGVGKTLEDLLNIKENNIPGPNSHLTELKSSRKNTQSMLTLFTKSPLPTKINGRLFDVFGRRNRDGKKSLHTILNATSRNTLYGKRGFIIKINGTRIEIDCPTDDLGQVPYWNEYILEKFFNRKYVKNLLYVKADHRNKGVNEEFHYTEAYLLSGFSFKHFKKLLKEGKIRIDVRIGQHSDGTPHDHGTGFRIMHNDLDLCFSTRERVL